MGLEQVRSTWQTLGRTDPLWAVMTHPDRRNGGWDADLHEFFGHGRREIDRLVETMANHGLSLGDRVLDFGCGVGRLSNALAEHASSVVGVDIAESMIEHAEAFNQHGERIQFHSYDGHSLPYPDAAFDSVVSLVVLQHTPPETQLAALLEMRRVVRPGGLIAVQIPSQPRVHPLPADAFRAELLALDTPEAVPTGRHGRLRVRVTNRSAHTWPADHQLRLGNHWLRDGRTLIRDDGRVDLPTAVEPGQRTELALPIATPEQPGHYELELDLVQENVGWFAEHGSETIRIPLRVEHAAPDMPAPAGQVQDVPDEHAGIEMHGLRVALVRELFSHCDCHIVDMVEDGRAGDEWESYTYFVRRGHSR